MQKTVAIIIPTYNSEKYITRCLESVLNQSFKNVQIIVVDDCSTDNTQKIIKQYITMYPNINYIKNSTRLGVGYSRNKGLNIVNADYVLFLDSDDWIDLNCIKYASDFFCNNEIDIIMWKISDVNSSNRIISKRYNYYYNNCITNNMAIKLLSHTNINEFYLSPLLGCKLFRYDLIKKNNLHFIDTYYEDDLFTYEAFLNANKVKLLNNCNLYYYQHSDSLSHKINEKQISDLFVTFKLMYNISSENNEPQKENCYKYFQKMLEALLLRIEQNVFSSSECEKYKALIFKLFFKNIDLNEFFFYCSHVTI